MFTLHSLVISLLCLSFCISQTRYTLQAYKSDLELSHKILLKQVGEIEIKPNYSPKIKQYLLSVGIKFPAPYCNAGQYYCFDCGSFNPMVKSGLAISTFQKAKRLNQKTAYQPQQNDLMVWNKPNTSFGHIERIVSVGKAGWVETVGFNTSSGVRGNQRDGGGVYRRKRNIYHPLSRNVIRGLVGWTNK